MLEESNAVQHRLQDYADRGVFRNLTQVQLRGSVVEYRFLWLHEKSFVMRHDAAASKLSFIDVLPQVPFHSDMDNAARRFLKSRSDERIPAHRRLDSNRFKFTLKNKKGALSFGVEFGNQDGDEAARSGINLLHEVFNNFLHQGPYQQYMIEQFNESEE